MALASDVMDQARKVYLFDKDGTLYTDEVLIPFFNDVLTELGNTFVRHSIQYTREDWSDSSVIPAAEDTQAGEGDARAQVAILDAPNNLITPLALYYSTELSGSNRNWVAVPKVNWIAPDSDPSIPQWAWREGVIHFKLPQGESEVSVRLHYERSLPVVSGPNSVIDPAHAKGYMAARMSYLVHTYVSNNGSMAATAFSRSETLLNDILAIESNVNQSAPARRQTRAFGQGFRQGNYFRRSGEDRYR